MYVLPYQLVAQVADAAQGRHAIRKKGKRVNHRT